MMCGQLYHILWSDRVCVYRPLVVGQAFFIEELLVTVAAKVHLVVFLVLVSRNIDQMLPNQNGLF